MRLAGSRADRGGTCHAQGRAGLYVRFDQMLTRPDPKSDRGLALFGVAMANVSGRVEESHYFELGWSRPARSTGATATRSAS
jgi:hypothetical protein